MILDTCILIDILRNKKEAIAFIKNLATKPSISVVTISELLAGVRTKKEQDIVMHFIEGFSVYPISEEIAEEAGYILQQFQKKQRSRTGRCSYCSNSIQTQRRSYYIEY